MSNAAEYWKSLIIGVFKTNSNIYVAAIFNGKAVNYFRKKPPS